MTCLHDTDSSRLDLLATASFQWLHDRLDRFSPFNEGRLTTERLKAFAEFSMLYGYFEEWRYSAVARIIPTDKLAVWRTFILRHCESPIYSEMVRKRPLQAYYYLIPYLILRATGHRTPYYEETLERLHSWNLPKAMEVVPYRFLDQQFFLWKSGFLQREPNWYQLYRNTLLGRRCNLVCIDEDATYSITHTLFYLTDFGNRPLPLNTAEVEHITDVVECLLVHNWRIAQWDLTGELLINLNCLGKFDSPFYSGASQAFQNVWRCDGAIPADPVSEKDLHSATELDSATVAFRVCYHTTLVGLLYYFTKLMRSSF